MLHDEDEGSVTPDDDDETRLVRRDPDDTRFVRRDADDDTRLVRHDVETDTRTVNPENDQTRVVDRHPVDETRVVDNPADPGGPAAIPDADDEATRLSARPAESTPESTPDSDPDRTQLSRRPRNEREQATASPTAFPATSSRKAPSSTSASSATPRGSVVGASRLPDAPVGSRASYRVRAPEPVAVPIQRIDLSDGNPQVELPATAEQIRHAASVRARRRSRVALGAIVLATVAVAGAATAVIVFISGL